MQKIPPFSAYMSIENYSEKCSHCHIGTTYAKNSFVLANTLEDYLSLQKRDINVALIN